MIMIEEWRPIPGYEGRYTISNFGQVKSLLCGRDKILKLNTHSRGYLFVVLRKDGKSCPKTVHRLVALTFIGNSNLCVDHINSNRKDNRAINLRYCTHRENTFHHFSKRKYMGTAKSGKKWKAVFWENGSPKYLGTFQSRHSAHIAFVNEYSKLKKV